MIRGGNATFRRIAITGYPVVEHYGEGHVLDATKSSSTVVTGGIQAQWQMLNTLPVTNLGTGSLYPEVVVDIKGKIPTDLSSADFADGSMWQGFSSTKTLGLRQGGAWRWL